MKLLSVLTVIVTAAAGPAFAEGKCATGPKSKWQPKSALETQLQADGYKVRQIKVEGGCYEVYATDKEGKRANMAYNAETLKKLSNAEAGEKLSFGAAGHDQRLGSSRAGFSLGARSELCGRLVKLRKVGQPA
jgi:hypothetical protein